MNFIIPENILNIINTLNKSGFQAHIVGGCVRDSLLNLKPSDWDITTDATPDEVKSLFGKTFDTGIKHCTVTVISDKSPVEVTTWRMDADYSDHRRPNSVLPAHSLVEDLARRDFTMNALAYHPREGLIDPFNGAEDIARAIIRCVGDPQKRFSEDALRMLRAIRFSAQLDFEIEAKTLQAIRDLSKDIIHISKERIQSEINKILESRTPEHIKSIWLTDLNTYIFPQIKSFPNEWTTAAARLKGECCQREALLALLFYFSSNHDKALASAREFLVHNKYDNNTKRVVSNYIQCINSIGVLTSRNLRKSITEYTPIIVENSLKMLGVDIDIIKEIQPIRPIISGANLMELGLQGPRIKQMIDLLCLCLYENPELNTRDVLIDIAKEAAERSHCFLL